MARPRKELVATSFIWQTLSRSSSTLLTLSGDGRHSSFPCPFYPQHQSQSICYEKTLFMWLLLKHTLTPAGGEDIKVSSILDSGRTPFEAVISARILDTAKSLWCRHTYSFYLIVNTAWNTQKAWLFRATKLVTLHTHSGGRQEGAHIISSGGYSPVSG